MAARLNLRCKTPSGMQILKDINSDTTVFQLKAAISSVCDIEANRLIIRSGFPPKVIDISKDDVTMNDMPFTSGDTLIVEEDKSKMPPKIMEHDSINSLWTAQLGQSGGFLTRKVVPANNSCLFTSVHCCMTNGGLDLEAAPSMRNLIAGAVSSQPDIYSEGVLGKPNSQYCDWILKGESWGGAIEVSILSKHYKVEIDVVDTQTGRIDRFGEDMNYPNRVFLLYDGIHYDPLVMEPLDGTSPVRTVFPLSDDVVVAQALEIASECQKSRQFTDVANFDLRCLVCQKPLKGQREAQEHAGKTGHTNFGEF